MMRLLPWLVGLIFLAGCSVMSTRESGDQAMEPPKGESMSESQQDEHPGVQFLRNMGKAPELENEVWINTDQPLRLADLSGKVILLDMWTFGCINCRNVIPSLNEWHQEYGDQGLVIIGNHYPEFTHEEDLGSLKEAVTRLEIPYAVAQDNDGDTWQAYNNRYWPTLYLIDKQGQIRYSHIGEGAYERTEEAIQVLLAEPSSK